MSKYMLFLTLFPAPTCVSWVTFFIITNNWKWRILKSITWILPIFLRFGVHGDRNHIWAVFQPADQRTPLKGDKRCNFQKAERKWYKVENKKKERKQMVDTFLLKTFSNLLPDHIQWMILIVPHHLKHFTNKLSLRFNRPADWLTASYFPFGYWNREFNEPFCTYLYVARKRAQKSCMETDVVDLVPSIFIFIGPNPNHCLPSSLTDVVKLNWCDSGLWG